MQFSYIMDVLILTEQLLHIIDGLCQDKRLTKIICRHLNETMFNKSVHAGLQRDIFSICIKSLITIIVLPFTDKKPNL